tara:strand:+ start:267 stop:1307 length:1041 start_codon:yes stop_codon:yes gene_type:complete
MRIADAQKIPLSVRIFCALSTLATPADFALAAGAGSDTAVVDTDRIETQAIAPSHERDASWIDSGHELMTRRANELTSWIDHFFGDAEVDAEHDESRLRIGFAEEVDERLGSDFQVRVGGKINLPNLSKRLDLVFRGDDPEDQINEEDDRSQSPVALQFQIGGKPAGQHRFDLTMGASSAGPKPGIKYRYGTNFSEQNSLRFVQRVQYDFDDGSYSTSRLFLDHRLSEDQFIRSSTRVQYGEQTDGIEWSSTLAHISRWPGGRDDYQAAISTYLEVSGRTEPWDYVSNYRVGLRLRRQAYRDYLMFELEPSYNWRVDEPELGREGAWKIRVKVEFMLFESLRRDRH